MKKSRLLSGRIGYAFLVNLLLSISISHAAPITSLTVTGGEFRMGAFTPSGPVAFTYTGPYNLVVDFPTPVGWNVNVGQNTQNGATPAPSSVVSFPFGDPLVNTLIAACDPQAVDNCVASPHTITSGTVGGGSATIANGDSITVDINGLYANWNGIDFNQGGTSGDGTAYPGKSYAYTYTSRVSNVVGNSFDYSMTWQSLIVGGPFNGQTGTWTFTGSGTVESPSPSISIVIPGGTPQECIDAGSSPISMSAQVTIDNADAVDTIIWKLDGSVIASGESVNISVPLGAHNIETTVTTALGQSATDSATITVEDTAAPVVSTGFINAKTGAGITTIGSRDKAVPSYNISDACDPAPVVVSAVVGVPAENVGTVSAKTSKKDSSVNLSIQGNADNIELTVIAEDASGNMSSNKAMLTIIP